MKGNLHHQEREGSELAFCPASLESPLCACGELFVGSCTPAGVSPFPEQLPGVCYLDSGKRLSLHLEGEAHSAIWDCCPSQAPGAGLGITSLAKTGRTDPLHPLGPAILLKMWGAKTGHACCRGGLLPLQMTEL